MLCDAVQCNAIHVATTGWDGTCDHDKPTVPLSLVLLFFLFLLCVFDEEREILATSAARSCSLRGLELPSGFCSHSSLLRVLFLFASSPL
jgi:hypothetical protein